MTVFFNRVARRIYDTLVSANYSVALFDAAGNRVYNPEKSRKFYAMPDKIMISIHEEGDEKSKIKVALSNQVNIENFERDVGKKLRKIAARQGQNMSYDIRTYGKELSPKDFAHQILTPDKESKMSETPIAEAARSRMTGTTRSSYQNVGECKVIVRHSDRVNEEKRGARSRNINSIFVETKSGERFKISENNIHAARAMARHLSNGGSPFDTVGMKITEMVLEMSELKTIMTDVRKLSRQGLKEESNELSAKISNRYCSLRETLKKMSGKVGYWRHSGVTNESEELEEYGEPPVNEFEKILRRHGYQRLGGGAVGSEIVFAKSSQGRYKVFLKIHPMSGGVMVWWIEDTTTNKNVAKSKSSESLFLALSELKEDNISEEMSHKDMELARRLGLPGNIDDWEQEHFDRFNNAKRQNHNVQEDEKTGFIKTELPKNIKIDSPLHELVLRMNQALEPQPQIDAAGKHKHKLDNLGMPQLLYHPSEIKDDEEWKNWSVASDKLASLLVNPQAEPLTKNDKMTLFNASKRLNVDLKSYGKDIKKAPETKKLSDDEIKKILLRKGVPSQHMDAAMVAYKEKMGITEMDKGTPIEGDIDVKNQKRGIKPSEDQIPVYNRPEEGIDKNHYVKELSRDDSEKMHSINYYTYEESKLPEEKILESWFDEMANVEFFHEEELKIEEDNPPTIKKILPETALHTLNMYLGHPLFDHYITFYDKQEILDQVIEMIEEDSKLYSNINMARKKLSEGPLVEFDYSQYDPIIIDQAIDKLKQLVNDRKMSLDDAIAQIADEVASNLFSGDDEAKHVIAHDLKTKAEQEGIAKHDFGSTFADDVLSTNNEIKTHKSEIDGEEYYGDAKFQEENIDEDPIGDMDNPGHEDMTSPEEDKEVEEEYHPNEGDRVKVIYHNKYHNQIGEVVEISPQGSFIIVEFPNGDTASMHTSDVELTDEDNEQDDYDDSMDGDHDSAMASAGMGSDEDYGYYGEDIERLKQLSGFKKKVNEVGLPRGYDGWRTDSGYENEPDEREIDDARNSADSLVNDYLDNSEILSDLKDPNLDSEDKVALMHDLKNDLLGYVKNNLSNLYNINPDSLNDSDILDIFHNKTGLKLPDDISIIKKAEENVQPRRKKQYIETNIDPNILEDGERIVQIARYKISR